MINSQKKLNHKHEYLVNYFDFHLYGIGFVNYYLKIQIT
jgi:hypothetical protein